MPLPDIIGHRDVLETLSRAHVTDTVHHAYLFAGPAGVGKRLVADWFAALVNCAGNASERVPEPCGRCRHCRRILVDYGSEEGVGHPDVIRLEPDGRTIKIAQVRDVIRVVPFPPIEAAYRVVIIDPADALGEASANALLKTLEEPPSRTRFILVSSRADALLVTIVSRCQRMVFGRLPPDDLAGWLTARHAVPEAQAHAVATVAGGSAGNALALLQDPVMSNRDGLVRRFLALGPRTDRAVPLELAAELADLREHLTTVFDVLLQLYRDLLILRSGASVGLAHPHLEAELRSAAARFGTQTLVRRLELIAETALGIRERYLNPRVGPERLLLSLAAPPGAEAHVVGVEGSSPTARRGRLHT